jgi:hypothetical protein
LSGREEGGEKEKGEKKGDGQKERRKNGFKLLLMKY